jgi:hypothetical protein
MAYGGAGLCTDFVLRPKKCKITAKIGKQPKIILGPSNFTMDQVLKMWPKNKKIIMSMSSNILELVIYERKIVFKKKLLPGVLPLCLQGLKF